VTGGSDVGSNVVSDGSSDDIATTSAAFAATLADEWARGGLRHAVIAPGSRSAPLALALLRDERVTVHVVVDERSAAFVALGIGKATSVPAAVLCTSGTAATNLHPAVVEAHHSRVPLLALTADRPPELQGVGAPQTIDQTHLYGSAVRWFTDPGPPERRAAASWRALARRAIDETTGRPAGPVHVNLAFREPLVAETRGAAVPGRAGAMPSSSASRAATRPADADVERLAQIVRNHRQGVVVAGWGSGASAATVDAFATASGWPVLADPISGLRRGPSAVSTADMLAGVDAYRAAHRPDAVLRLGGPPTSKALATWLAALGPEVPHVLVDPDDVSLDPDRLASWRAVVDPDELLGRVVARLDDEPPDRAWLDAWRRADAVVREALDDALDGGDCDEGRVARDVVDAVPPGGSLAVASSMPVRDVDGFARPRDDITIHANRGANGIDGFTSTVVGIALGTAHPTVGLLGDLCFLHDTNGLLDLARRDVDLVLVIVDNDGGGIFSFLPHADLTAPDEFEAAFGTPHGIDLVALAQAHRVPAERVKAADVGGEVRDRLARGGAHVVVVPSDRAENVAAHRRIRQRVADALV
jgi:2-succinyl-5-enolpyruvyl-6-hydroxy-3-cyclohexene-1-carboxylate synthase